MKPKISAIIIAKNEAEHLNACLASLAWVNEIIVLDSGSSDDTLNIAHQYTDLVYSTDWQGFGIQKNRALDKAQHPWVLSIDADEQISPALADEIQQAIQDPHTLAWQIPRQSSYCGQQIQHSGWSPDYVTRLFQRQSARFSNALVHEKLELIKPGKIGSLKQPLLHHAFSDFEEVLDKINRYSSASAEMAHNKGRQASLSTAILHGVWSFIRTYILKAGFLDGRMGFILAISNAEGSYYRYLKIMLATQNSKNCKLK